MLTCKYFARRTLSVILVKFPDFGQFISLDRINSIFLLNTKKFSFLTAGFFPKILAFARKNNGFA